MRSRLFWKILFAFGLTFFLMIQVIALLLQARLNSDRGPDFTVGPPAVIAAQYIVQSQGTDAFQGFKGQLPGSLKNNLVLKPGVSIDPLPGPVFSRQVRAPDGQLFTITWDAESSGTLIRMLNMPPEVLIIGIIGAFVFSAALAFYLTIPIERLRRGFAELAGGNLDSRVGIHMGRRNDEIAALGQAFDAMARRLEDLVNSRVRLLHDVSHEFRSPLARVQMAVGLIEQSHDNKTRCLERINLEVDRLNDLIEELLTLARLETGGLLPDSELFDLVEIAASVVSDAQFETEGASGEISLELLGDLPRGQSPLVRGDPRLIRRALENIVRNAIKFSPQEAPIRVSVALSSERKMYLIAISDEGRGVDESLLASIFDPFVRTANQKQGHGLGLAIAKRAIEAHGGQIRAFNNQPRGFCVTLHLPASIAPKA